MIKVFMHFFIIFFFTFLNLTLLIFIWTQSNFPSARHDNQFFLLFFSSYLFRALMRIINGRPGLSTTLHVRIVLKGVVF